MFPLSPQQARFIREDLFFRGHVHVQVLHPAEQITAKLINLGESSDPQLCLDILVMLGAEQVLYAPSEGLALPYKLAEKLQQSAEDCLRKAGQGAANPVGSPASPEPATPVSASAAEPLNPVTTRRGCRRRRQFTVSHLLADATAVELAHSRTGKDRVQRRAALEYLKAHPVLQIPCAHRRLLARLDALALDFPNFHAVIEHLRLDLQLAIRLRRPASFLPLLLQGPPGVGKTEFARALAAQLGQAYWTVSVAALTSSAVLKGTTQHWGNGSPGGIATAVVDAGERPLLVLFDEVDKISQGAVQHPVEPVLLELLEDRQLQHFQDECLEVEINLAGLVSFVLTANDLDAISAPLRSRMREFCIPAPTQEQMPAVVRSIDRLLRADRPGLAKVFEPLSEACTAVATDISPRTLRRVLEQAYSRAIAGASSKSRRCRLEPRHLEAALAQVPAPETRGMGFLDDASHHT